MSEPLRPMFSYFGSKWRLSRLLPPPTEARIVEPFAGGAGYSLRYGAGLDVLLVDIDERLCALWRYLIRVRESEVRRLPLLAPGQTTRDLQGIPPEARDLIGFWISKGTAHPCVIPCGWMRRGDKPNTYWGEVIRERVASQLRHIRRWRVECRDYTRASVRGRATWMVDPPYRVLGKHYRRDSGGIDYSLLASWCRARRGQVIVTEAEGARWLPFVPVHAGRGVRQHAVEVVWYGGAR